MKNTTKTTAFVIAASLGMIASSKAVISVVVDVDFSTFADGTGDFTPNGLNASGDATISSGQLVLDGAGDYVQTSSTFTTAADNFVLEVVGSAAGFGPFNFGAALNTGTTNNGGGILAQSGNWNALSSGIGFFGSAGHGGAPTNQVSIALVRNAGDVSLFVNGVEFGAGGVDGWDNPGTGAQLTIGGHGFDVPAGTWNGTIDRVRYSTSDVPESSNAALFAAAAIPEPTSVALLGLGGLALLRRRRK